ncbi:unnamed protein product [Amoebophrya sp. A120]|nr:unnamed protein product [Amoebophrya sp. A120]|eukprot:GSA120T00022730001.1
MSCCIPSSVPELDAFFARQVPTGFTSGEAEGGQMTYGEILSEGVKSMLTCSAALLPPARARDCVFLDLGSGIGKGPIAASILARDPSCGLRISRAIGIELSHQRHAIAELALHRMTRDPAATSSNKRRRSSRKLSASPGAGLLVPPVVHAEPEPSSEAQLLEQQVLLQEGDAIKDSVAAIAAADVIWISNMCFPKTLTTRIAHLLDGFAKKGAVVFSSRELFLVREHMDLAHEQSLHCKPPIVPQSWHGGHEVFVYHITGGTCYGRQLHWPRGLAASAYYTDEKSFRRKKHHDRQEARRKMESSRATSKQSASTIATAADLEAGSRDAVAVSGSVSPEQHPVSADRGTSMPLAPAHDNTGIAAASERTTGAVNLSQTLHTWLFGLCTTKARGDGESAQSSSSDEEGEDDFATDEETSASGQEEAYPHLAKLTKMLSSSKGSSSLDLLAAPLEDDRRRQVFWNAKIRNTEDSIARAFSFWSLFGRIPEAGADRMYNTVLSDDGKQPVDYRLYPWGLPKVPSAHTKEFYKLRVSPEFLKAAIMDALLHDTSALDLLELQLATHDQAHDLAFRDFRRLVYKYKPHFSAGWW